MGVIKHKDQRVGVLIDVQNLYHSAKHLHGGARVNFKEVLKDAVQGRKLIRAFAYVVRTETEEEKSFFDALTRMGIEMRVKDLQIFPGGVKKGDWDVGLAIDAVRLSDLLDAIVIISGDGDYVPLIEYLKYNKGVQVEAMAFKRSTSSRLIDAVDDFMDIGADPKRFLLKR